IEGASAGLAGVRTISLGGAYLESPRKLTVGDSIKLEVRSGLRRINFTAVVRNIGPDGNGVEFVYMHDEDRAKLRKLVQRHLQLSLAPFQRTSQFPSLGSSPDFAHHSSHDY